MRACVCQEEAEALIFVEHHEAVARKRDAVVQQHNRARAGLRVPARGRLTAAA